MELYILIFFYHVPLDRLFVHFLNKCVGMHFQKVELYLKYHFLLCTFYIQMSWDMLLAFFTK